jgi:hypothetical protein
MEHDPTDHGQAHEHGNGLHEDLVKLASRRDALRIFGAGGAAAAILGTLGAGPALAAKATGVVPTETAGPYPGTGPTAPTSWTTRASSAAASAAALAAHPLRGLRVRRQGRVERPDRQDVADRDAAGGLQAGLRDQRLRGQHEQPGPDVAVVRQRLRRRPGDPPARDRDGQRRQRATSPTSRSACEGSGADHRSLRRIGGGQTTREPRTPATRRSRGADA